MDFVVAEYGRHRGDENYQKIAGFSPTPIIGITAYGDAYFEKEIEVGCNGLLDKLAVYPPHRDYAQTLSSKLTENYNGIRNYTFPVDTTVFKILYLALKNYR